MQVLSNAQQELETKRDVSSPEYNISDLNGARDIIHTGRAPDNTIASLRPEHKRRVHHYYYFRGKISYCYLSSIDRIHGRRRTPQSNARAQQGRNQAIENCSTCLKTAFINIIMERDGRGLASKIEKLGVFQKRAGMRIALFVIEYQSLPHQVIFARTPRRGIAGFSKEKCFLCQPWHSTDLLRAPVSMGCRNQGVVHEAAGVIVRSVDIRVERLNKHPHRFLKRFQLVPALSRRMIRYSSGAWRD